MKSYTVWQTLRHPRRCCSPSDNCKEGALLRQKIFMYSLNCKYDCCDAMRTARNGIECALESIETTLVACILWWVCLWTHVLYRGSLGCNAAKGLNRFARRSIYRQWLFEERTHGAWYGCGRLVLANGSARVRWGLDVRGFRVRGFWWWDTSVSSWWIDMASVFGI